MLCAHSVTGMYGLHLVPPTWLHANLTFLPAACAEMLLLALADYNAVLHIQPNNVHALHSRGLVHEKRAELDQAIADFTTCLALDPNYVKASYSRAACRNRKNDLVLAIGER